MNSIVSYSYNLFRTIKSKLDKKVNILLIPILVKYELFNLLSLVLIYNLKTINKVKPNNKIKFKVIVLSKSGGLDDLIYSQSKYNENILYLQSFRSFFKHIYFTKLKSINKVNIKDCSIEEIEIFKERYLKFLIKFLKILKNKYKIDAFIGFNYIYYAEKELHKACSKLGIPFLLLYKETVLTEIEKKYLEYVLKQTDEKFNGYKIAVYSKFAEKILIDSNFTNKNKIEIIGCSRLGESFSFKKILPKNQIVYYAIQDDRGLPHRFVNQFGSKFFENFNYHRYYDPEYNWKDMHFKVLKILKKFALNHPEIEIIIKNKIGKSKQKDEYSNLPKNIKINSDGVGHQLLERSKVVIAWNTTAIIEGIAANRFILLPYFHVKNNNFEINNELILKLNDENYGFSEEDFYKKLNAFINRKYDTNQIYNNQFSLNYYLGNEDNNADIRLNNFLKKNIKFNKY